MKQFKRTICILLSVLMLMSAAAVSASAADTNNSSTYSSGKVYFDASGWKNVTQIYCHIWKRGGDAFIGWQLKKEQCTKEGSKWAYDLANLDGSTTMSGGLKDGVDYCIIFSAQTGKQTYDATFSKACVGDTLKLTGKLIENPVDSEKKADEAVWSKNSGKYGPHLAFTSIGNIVGSKLCPNEKGTDVIGDWLPIYYKSKFVKPVTALAKAYPKFGIKSAADIQTIYAYILKKKTGEDEAAMKKMLEDAFKKAYPSKKNEAKIDVKKAKSLSKSISSGSSYSAPPYLSKKKKTLSIGGKFTIKVRNKKGYRATFYSTNKKVATVNSKGKVRAQKNGKATIKVYIRGKTLKCKIKVRKPKLSPKKVTLIKGKTKKLKVKYCKCKIKWKSSNKKVATVTKKGVIKTKKPGKATITAKIKSVKLKCKVTVKRPPTAREKLRDYIQKYGDSSGGQKYISLDIGEGTAFIYYNSGSKKFQFFYDKTYDGIDTGEMSLGIKGGKSTDLKFSSYDNNFNGMDGTAKIVIGNYNSGSHNPSITFNNVSGWDNNERYSYAKNTVSYMMKSWNILLVHNGFSLKQIGFKNFY